MQNYSGNPANVSNSLAATVAGTASGTAGVIRIQTSSAHLFSTYDRVVLENVGGTTEANGLWTITVIDATHFELDGSTFVNAWTSGGTATDVSLTPYFSVPDDGEPGTAVSIEASVKLLADRTQFLAARIGAANAQAFTSTTATTWRVPVGVTSIAVGGCGGGGGGGGGAGGSTQTNQYAMGGGGGGGARWNVKPLAVTAGQQLSITCGAAGASGTFGAGSSSPTAVNPGTDGGDGGDSLVQDTLSSSVLARFRGGQGGQGGIGGASADVVLAYAKGGGDINGPQSTIFDATVSPPLFSLLVTGHETSRVAQEGGIGRAANHCNLNANASTGMYAPSGGVGGAAGSPAGTDDNPYKGGGIGGGGGGGGASPSAAGGAGGAGSNAVNGGSSGVGGTGSAPSANTGAGGGGGGGAGHGSVSGAHGGAGASGATGYVIIFW